MQFLFPGRKSGRGAFRASIECAALIGSLGLMLTACGKDGTSVLYKPTIGRADDGTIRAMEKDEADTFCVDHFCETNHVYTASFGKRKPAPAPLPPNPTPTPVPSPTPGNFPPNTPETLDYSRAIMNLDRAWAVNEGSPDIVVAVVDTGMQLDHPDLKDNLWVNTAELNGKPGVDDDGDGYIDDVYGWDFANNRANPVDDNGHGTHVSGIIAAEKNAIGARGIAPHVKIMPLKFLGANGNGDTKNAIDAINYAVKHGARVISNSWGGAGYSQLLDEAIQNARKAGVIVVAAAGNDHADNDVQASYPANLSGVVSVGSSTSQDTLSDFSDYGLKSVTIVAPGSAIFSTYLQSTFKYLSGTSMATPQVAGAIALGLSVRKDLGADELLDVLCTSTANVLRTKSKCGRLDVGRFIEDVASLVR